MAIRKRAYDSLNLKIKNLEEKLSVESEAYDLVKSNDRTSKHFKKQY